MRSIKGQRLQTSCLVCWEVSTDTPVPPAFFPTTKVWTQGNHMTGKTAIWSSPSHKLNIVVTEPVFNEHWYSHYPESQESGNVSWSCRIYGCVGTNDPRIRERNVNRDEIRWKLPRLVQSIEPQNKGLVDRNSKYNKITNGDRCTQDSVEAKQTKVPLYHKGLNSTRATRRAVEVKRPILKKRVLGQHRSLRNQQFCSRCMPVVGL